MFKKFRYNFTLNYSLLKLGVKSNQMSRKYRLVMVDRGIELDIEPELAAVLYAGKICGTTEWAKFILKTADKWEEEGKFSRNEEDQKKIGLFQDIMDANVVP